MSLCLFSKVVIVWFILSSLEERVRDQMKKAYWDIFDEAISSNDPNPAYALGVFREMKLVSKFMDDRFDLVFWKIKLNICVFYSRCCYNSYFLIIG